MRNLTPDQLKIWKIAAGVVIAGTGIKSFYYQYTRDLIVETMEKKDREAVAHLHEAREYAKWAKKDREAQVPQLTPEQSADLRRFILEERRKRERTWDRLESEN